MIKSTSLKNIRVMEFFTLASNVKDYLAAEDLNALRIDAIVNNEYIPAFNAFDEALKPLRKTGLTDALLEADTRRDAAMVGLGAHVRAFIDFLDTAKAEAAARLKTIIDKYGKSPQRLSLTEQTGVVINLLQDLAQPQAQTDLALIGAETWAVKMETDNNEFQNIFKERIGLEATFEAGKTRATRDAVQDVFSRLCERINALALIDGVEPYQRIIDNINREVARARQIARQRSKTATQKNDETIESE